MVQDITTQSWGSRIMSSFFGILIGIALIVGSFILIFWNEGNGLHTAQSLQQAQKVVIDIAASPINEQNNLRVVHFSDMANTNDTLSDSQLGLSEKAIKLDRQVEMYQWKEHTDTKSEKQLGGSEKEVTNYTYELAWSNSLIDSSKFKDPVGHQNPDKMPLAPQVQYAKTVMVGEFNLPTDLIKRISGSQSVDLSKISIDDLSTALDKTVHHDGSDIYIGEDSALPKVGDAKVTVTEVMPQTVSVLAQQTGKSVQPYLAPAGQTVMLLTMGQHSSDEMISDAQSENRMMTWIFRIVSLVMMVIGISLLMRPLVVLADVIPFLGTMVGFGTGIIALLLGLVLWSIAIAIAWITVRPLMAIGLLILVGGICYMLYRSRKNKTKEVL
jgi:hypothetical protein